MNRFMNQELFHTDVAIYLTHIALKTGGSYDYKRIDS